EWNEWRKENLTEKIMLKSADLRHTSLSGANLLDADLFGANLLDSNLGNADLSGTDFGNANISKANLSGANLTGANLSEANLSVANLTGADLSEADLSNVNLSLADLTGANLMEADLSGAFLTGADLSEADLSNVDLSLADLTGAKLLNANLTRVNFLRANLTGVRLWMADLTRAELMHANLMGAEFFQANLKRSEFQYAIVDGRTLILDCSVDRNTDFNGVGLGSIRIAPGTRQRLEYNIRRNNWDKWYTKHKVLQWIVKPFWWASDYGKSTGRIVGVFFGIAVFFALIIYVAGLLFPPGIIQEVFENPFEPEVTFQSLTRTIYYSVVTMTTLGGYMMPYPFSEPGHLILMLHVLSGYVILGALITRFSILFTAGGPAGKFADEKSIITRIKERIRRK
ncbi:pentapeptide repeat-containing protein, partial [Candidatus Omnitrophota bacterium]